MNTAKKLLAFTAAVLTAASVFRYSTDIAAVTSDIIIIPETGSTDVDINTDKGKTAISPYIYGINDQGSLTGIKPTVIKQCSDAVSSYNWETNYSNSGKKGLYTNDVALIDSYPSSMWDSPALYTESMINRAQLYNIPVRLVTLQLMGYVAADSMGIVSPGETGRWNTIGLRKNEAYLSQPDTDDDVVYIDEYVSYLVDKYGSVSEGGINGYFLDSEPDKWESKYEVLGLEPITADELIERSVTLADSIKTIDSKAFVFGPSVSGLQGCIDLGNSDSDANSSIFDGGYSWFIDYYLAQMRSAGEKLDKRLLDVLDIHYYTEALTPIGISVLYNDDPISNAFRMQAVRTLWDSDYTENSSTALINKQFTPLIPTLQASIRMNYPGTRLSFSEYDFGGGNNISGAIAQVDALGTFAREEVYLACLSPVSEDYSYQKAALRLFTDYDGNGSSFGDTLVKASNGGDTMSSVYAATDSNDPRSLNIILTNQNQQNEKLFNISVKSKNYSYSVDNVYMIDDDSSEIVLCEDEFLCQDNSIELNARPTSVYLISLTGNAVDESIWSSETESSDIPDDIHDIPEDITETGSEETTNVSETQPVVSETQSSSSYVNPADETAEDLTEASSSETSAETSVTEPEKVSETVPSSDESQTEASEPVTYDESKGQVALPIKILISVLVIAVAGGVGYILIFDKK
ncbi:MAG: glycoside hydrolase family 44 protein [Huintestinicola sp.]